MKQMKYYLMLYLILLFLVMIMVMISVAFFTLLERKIMALFHYRKGPNKVGLIGVLQPFSDALKLLGKEIFIPMNSNINLYIISPMFMLILMLLLWILYPFVTNEFHLSYGVLYFLCIVSINVYTLFFMGWASNSVYSMIGSIRSIAQSISYEVVFAISLLIIFNMMNILDLLSVGKYLGKYGFMMFYIILLFLFLSILAEINRTPFDLSESESELVSGFNVEYGAGKFVLIFLSEYGSLMFMMMLMNLMMMSKGVLFFFSYMLMLFLVTWVRISFPRVRYDNLMYLCWFYLLSCLLLNYIFYMFIKFFIDLIILN